MNKELRVPFNAPLREEDTEEQTFGCRQNNPDICGNNGLPEYKTQEKIGQFLYLIEEKIKNNNKINNNLSYQSMVA